MLSWPDLWPFPPAQLCRAWQLVSAESSVRYRALCRRRLPRASPAQTRRPPCFRRIRLARHERGAARHSDCGSRCDAFTIPLAFAVPRPSSLVCLHYNELRGIDRNRSNGLWPWNRPARVAKSADAKDLKSFGGQPPCGFKSHPGHQNILLRFNKFSSCASFCATTRCALLFGAATKLDARVPDRNFRKELAAKQIRRFRKRRPGHCPVWGRHRIWDPWARFKRSPLQGSLRLPCDRHSDEESDSRRRPGGRIRSRAFPPWT
jgi:hypothetical protein